MIPYILYDSSVMDFSENQLDLKGLDLSRFKKNPVMQFDHYGLPIGNWKNIRVEGSQLKADAHFFDEEPLAIWVKDKVQKGVLKGASVGVKILEESREQKMIEGQRGATITKSQLFEASIVAIGDNPNALAQTAEAEFSLQKSAASIKKDLTIFKNIRTEMNSIETILKTIQEGFKTLSAEFKSFKPDVETFKNGEDGFKNIETSLKGIEGVLKTSIENLKPVEPSEDILNAVKKQADTFKTEFKNLKSELDTFKTELKDLKELNSDLKTSNDALKSDIAALKGKKRQRGLF